MVHHLGKLVFVVIIVIASIPLTIGSMFVYDSPLSGGLITHLFALSPILMASQALYGYYIDSVLVILLSVLYFPIISFLLHLLKGGNFHKKKYGPITL